RYSGNGGIDFGAKRRVLAKNKEGSRLLWISQGHYASQGARGFGRSYIPTSLVLQAPKDRSAYTLGVSIADGRITKTKLLELGDRIDEFFGTDGLDEKIDLKKTLVIG